ncbi:MAG: pseudouridine synthase [Crocinitomicaceae bacterium]|nr:pseudouridine synthase [Crocinitomicaceae bacterium]
MKTYHYYLIFKPYGMLSQFSGEANDAVLGDLFNFPKDVYPVGRLDKDSEGLLLLTNDNRFKQFLLEPKFKVSKEYWVQVEGVPSSEQITNLSSGRISIKHEGRNHRVAPCEVEIMSDFVTFERSKPIRFRKNIPTTWLKIILREGKNRQVRKMTAAVGLPTLRLMRGKIGTFNGERLSPGDVITLQKTDLFPYFGYSSNQ